MDVDEAPPRKRLNFTLARGEGILLRDREGDSTVQVLDLDGTATLVVAAVRPAQCGRFRKEPGGPGVVVGEAIVRVTRIGVEGRKAAALEVSCPEDVLVIANRAAVANALSGSD